MATVEAAFFDLDKTVIAKPSIAAFGRPLRQGGLINRRTMFRALVSQLIYLQLGADERRLIRVRESMLALCAGWDRDNVRRIIRTALLPTVEPLFYAEALDLMAGHRKAGHRVYLVSGAPEEIVLPLAELLGADGCIASLAEVDADGRYTGRMSLYADGPHKAIAMAEVAAANNIDLSASTAYSDAVTDLPMLEAVGHPVVVNPDRQLGRLAREREWEVRQFTKPVRIRDRVGGRTPFITTGLALAVTAVLLKWFARRHRVPIGPRSTLSAGHPQPATA